MRQASPRAPEQRVHVASPPGHCYRGHFSPALTLCSAHRPARPPCVGPGCPQQACSRAPGPGQGHPLSHLLQVLAPPLWRGLWTPTPAVAEVRAGPAHSARPVTTGPRHGTLPLRTDWGRVGGAGKPSQSCQWFSGAGNPFSCRVWDRQPGGPSPHLLAGEGGGWGLSWAGCPRCTAGCQYGGHGTRGGAGPAGRGWRCLGSACVWGRGGGTPAPLEVPGAPCVGAEVGRGRPLTRARLG